MKSSYTTSSSSTGTCYKFESATYFEYLLRAGRMSRVVATVRESRPKYHVGNNNTFAGGAGRDAHPFLQRLDLPIGCSRLTCPLVWAHALN